MKLHRRDVAALDGSAERHAVLADGGRVVCHWRRVRMREVHLRPVAEAVDAGVTDVAAVVDAGPPPPPESFDSALEKAKRAASQKRSRDAAKWAKRALELRAAAPASGSAASVIEAQIILGFASIDLGVLENARVAFRQVLAKEPKNCDAQIGFATILDQQQKTEDARKEYMTYVENCPNGKELEAAKGAISRLE